MDTQILSKAQAWLAPAFDADTRQAVQHMIDNDPNELEDAFYKELEFGTGGLRGVMGTGTNRINRYTIGMATQGLANYLNSVFGSDDIHVAIAHDSRNRSDEFARTTAEVFAANGITVHLFEGLRPTPELSFSIRELGCQAGVVITASHNPKEYNGYKVYWEDGGQLIPPHDKRVIEEVRKVSVQDVKFDADSSKILPLGEDMDDRYLSQVAGLSFRQGESDLKVVFTALHGTGIQSVPPALAKMGFSQVQLVEEQATPDGDFPTVHSPNPEETAAMSMALEQGKSWGADLILGTDPDSDRVGIGVRNHKDELVLLNGNQAGSLLVDYLLRKWKETGRIQGKEFVAKTVVTSDLIARLAAAYDVPCQETLTGFKYIAEQIRLLEDERKFIGGGEESYGYLAGDFVRDKDAVISSVMLAEAASDAADRGSSMFDRLLEIYIEHGFFLERLISLTKKGKAGAEAIQQMMVGFRENPPAELAGTAVSKVRDYKAQTETDLASGTSEPIDLPSANVMQFVLADGSKVTARPSGTEPKIKFYFSVIGTLNDKAGYDAEHERLTARIDALCTELGLT